jgi:hypothetical protein
VIESFLVTLNAIPTVKMLPVVRADELDHVSGYSIATLTAFD